MRKKAKKQREAEMHVKMQNEIIQNALGYENSFAAYQKIVKQSKANPGVHELSVQLSKLSLKPNAEYHSELGKEKKFNQFTLFLLRSFQLSLWIILKGILTAFVSQTT